MHSTLQQEATQNGLTPAFLDELTNYWNAVLWIDIQRSVTDCRDAKNNKFLEAAASANATYLISGDEDLLILHLYEGIQIVSPADFLLV